MRYGEPSAAPVAAGAPGHAVPLRRLPRGRHRRALPLPRPRLRPRPAPPVRAPALSPSPPPLRHPFYPRCAFVFLPRPPGGPSVQRYCNACGRDVAGYVYHCRACGFDLHPCCAALPHALDAPGGAGVVRLYLCPDSRAAGAAPCHRCGHRGRSWSYRSQCRSYSLHVACVVDMLVESWHGVGRHKSAGGNGGGIGDIYGGGGLVAGSGGYRVPVIRGAAKSSHASRGSSYWGRRKKGKVKRCCEIAGFASQVVISAVLGDPSALIAGVIGSLIAL
ncbi:hypothetical protein EJB05_00642, partial [Eragrostis curvula]